MNEIETASVTNLVYLLKPLGDRKYITEHYLMKARFNMFNFLLNRNHSLTVI